jgi:hypothetical protein
VPFNEGDMSRNLCFLSGRHIAPTTGSLRSTPKTFSNACLCLRDVVQGRYGQLFVQNCECEPLRGTQYARRTSLWEGDPDVHSAILRTSPAANPVG